MEKKILFITGTRADYGKLKSLMKKVENSQDLDLYVFITGMHMLSKYGSTHSEVDKDNFKNTFKYINQTANTSMDIALSNTINGLSSYVAELKPDMIVIHGDRLEALAGAIVGAFNNIKVAHIEGGEVSGTIDESVRHAITKFSHMHFVANNEAKNRIIQLGEDENSIFIIGSPDIDIMYSSSLPDLIEVKERYDIPFSDYAILMYHPVTTDTKNLKENIRNLVNAVLNSGEKYIVIYPNNDFGTEIILSEYERLENQYNFKIYPSVRFEHFLTLLKNAKFIIGNSSAGIREASVYGVPSIDIGNRQQGRVNKDNETSIIHCNEDENEIIKSIDKATVLELKEESFFGTGNSDELFIGVIESNKIWQKEFQKKFIDLNFGNDNYV